jgi:glycosyltransferase involved in cell wall biosynthesis
MAGAAVHHSGHKRHAIGARPNYILWGRKDSAAVGKKYLFYTHALAGGGAERVMSLLASGFVERGCDVIFACDRSADENRAYLDARARLAVLPAGHMASTRALAALLRAEAPDVALSGIGVSNLKLFLAAAMAGRLKRSAQSLHGYFHSEPQWLSRIGALMAPLTSRLMARTVTVSDGLDAYARRRYLVSAARTRRIYNPVLARAAQPRTLADLTARPPIVLASGRFAVYKNFPLLVRAFAHVTTPGARLVLLGEGADRPRIEAEVARLQLGDRVALTGYQSEPWRYYDQARLFVSSADSEAFGLVVVEAMAYGLPVVSTRTEGPSEILENGRLGAIVPRDDEMALASAIDDALANPGDPAARQRRARDFSVETAIDAYQALFDEIAREAVQG